MKNTYNMFNTPVNQCTISFTEVNEIPGEYVNMAMHNSIVCLESSLCSTRYSPNEYSGYILTQQV